MNYNEPILTIPNATETDKDAAQYMIRYGKIQYNLCGEFCIAYCAQDNTHTDNVEDYLNYWEVKQRNFKPSFFPNNTSRTTGLVDLEKLLVDYGYTVPAKRLTSINVNIYSFAMMLDYHQAIVGVHIDWTGYLVGRGTPHWVVLENIIVADSNHATATIYNPYTNKLEPYSWREFMTSTGAYKNGIWIER